MKPDVDEFVSEVFAYFDPKADPASNYGSIGAFLVMGAAPVILLYFILSQKITKGMVAGAVKG